MLLISNSLKYMRTAALESSSSTHPCACGTAHGFYTGKEIRAREAEQARWASEKFSDCLDPIVIEEAVFPTSSPAIVLEESPSNSSTSSAHIAPLPEAAGGSASGILYCETCATAGFAKSFSGPDAECNLRRHTREKHEGKTFPCPSCHAPFSRLHNLRTHWMRKHKEMDMPASLDTRSRGRSAAYRVSPY